MSPLRRAPRDGDQQAPPEAGNAGGDSLSLQALHTAEEQQALADLVDGFAQRNDLEELLELFRNAVSAEDGFVVSKAAHAMRDLADPAVIPALIDALRCVNGFISDPAHDTLVALQGLSVPALVQGLDDSDANRRSKVSRALSELRESAVGALVEALRSPNPAVRAGAAEALQWSEFRRSDTRDYVEWSVAPEAVPALLDASHDDEIEVRRASAEALWGSRDPLAVKRFIELLADPDARDCAIEGVAQMGDRAAVDPLVAMLNDPSWVIQKDAVRALARIGDPSAVPALIELKDQIERAGAPEPTQYVMPTVISAIRTLSESD
jgi:HEAT repeat protein